jgi:thioredoxin-like negative regulator of GroEL
MALTSPNVKAVAVEAQEFPELARQFGVQSVPLTVVNRGQGFVGALPEAQFVAAALELAGVALDGEEPPPAEGPHSEPV